MTDETVTPAAGPSASGYPITVTFEPPERVARWRPLVQWLLVVPHLVVLMFVGIFAFILVLLGWFAGVFAGKIPQGLQKPVAMYYRYSLRVNVYSYFLATEYPPFAFDASFEDPGDYPSARFDVVPAIEGRSRLTIFFRYLMGIPQFFVLFFVGIAAAVVSIIGWFAVLILGRWPGGLQRFLLGYLRWISRVNGYMNLLTDEYPPFSTQ